jgi:hypothetical protein
VLGIDEGGHAAGLLGVGEDGQREGGFTGGFRAEDLDDASAGDALAAQREIEREGAGGDAGDVVVGVLVETHDRALAEGLIDLGECPVEGLLLLLVIFGEGLVLD